MNNGDIIIPQPEESVDKGNLNDAEKRNVTNIVTLAFGPHRTTPEGMNAKRILEDMLIKHTQGQIELKYFESELTHTPLLAIRKKFLEIFEKNYGEQNEK